MAVSLESLTVVNGDSPRGPRDDSTHDTDDLYTALANRRRRFVIHRLLQEDGECNIRDLSRVVAAWEYGKEPSEVTAAERHRVYNSLQQLHLPKLDSYGFVDYNHSRGTVSPTGKLDEFTLYLEVVPRSDISWSTYYLLLAVFSLVLNAATWFAIGPFAVVPLAATTFTAVGLFLGSALVHRWHSSRQRVGLEGPPLETDL